MVITRPSMLEVHETVGRPFFLGRTDACARFHLEEKGPLARRSQKEETSPWSTERIISCGKSAFVFFDVGISISHMQQVAPSGLIQSQLERSETAHTAETEEPAWRFIRREVIPQSINVGAAQLPDWLQEDEEMPTIRRLVYAALAYRLSTGRKLFTRAEACSRTKTPKGRYITVGDSPAGFIIGSWDGTPSKMFGLAPEVKHLPE